MPTVQTTVVLKGGVVKTVANYGSAGPPDLWVLENAMDGVAARTPWRLSPPRATAGPK